MPALRLFPSAPKMIFHRSVLVRAHGSDVTRRRFSILSVATLALATAGAPQAQAAEFADSKSMNILNRTGAFSLTDQEWKAKLSPAQFSILREANTERPFVSPLNNEKRPGTVSMHNTECFKVSPAAATPPTKQCSLPSDRHAHPSVAGAFTCAGCGSPLFPAEAKYDSGTGWPSFYKPLAGAVDEVPDNSIFFMPRTEVRCHRCQGHLGHVFTDGPKPTGLRYCMNGLALSFEPSGNVHA